MDRNLPSDDEFELTRRRLVEEVTESVETTLKKRYTWLAIVVSFLIGGGVVAITDNFTKGIRGEVQEQVVRAKLKIGIKIKNRCQSTTSANIKKYCALTPIFLIF